MGEQGKDAREKVSGAVAISVPYDLEQSVELLDRGFNREVYTRSLLSGLKAKVRAKQNVFPDAARYDVIAGCRTFKIFDREATARLNGFRDEVDYWTRSSCRPFLKSIYVPTFLIHAEDDPFFPGQFLPHKDIQRSDFLHTLFVPQGGHVGFVTGGWPWIKEYWLEDQILDFLKSKVYHIENQSAPGV